MGADKERKCSTFPCSGEKAGSRNFKLTAYHILTHYIHAQTEPVLEGTIQIEIPGLDNKDRPMARSHYKRRSGQVTELSVSRMGQ